MQVPPGTPCQTLRPLDHHQLMDDDDDEDELEKTVPRGAARIPCAEHHFYVQEVARLQCELVKLERALFQRSLWWVA